MWEGQGQACPWGRSALVRCGHQARHPVGIWVPEAAVPAGLRGVNEAGTGGGGETQRQQGGATST